MNKVEVAVRCFVCGDIVSANLDVPAGKLLGPCTSMSVASTCPDGPTLKDSHSGREGPPTPTSQQRHPVATPSASRCRNVTGLNNAESCRNAVRHRRRGCRAGTRSQRTTPMARSPGHASSSCRDAATAAALRLPKLGQGVSGLPKAHAPPPERRMRRGDPGFSGAHWDSDVVYRLPRTRRLSADRRTTPSAPSNGRWASATARHTPSLRAALSLANSPHIGSATSWT